MAGEPELPLPPHVDLAHVADVWRVDYEARFADASAWAAEHGLEPAATDTTRVCLFLVDMQNTFCTPGFELFVAGRSGTGALEDSRRLCAFLYRNLGAISETVVTLDTHQAFQIFHAPFLVDAQGRHPSPYTLVSAEDVASGRWHVDPDAAAALRLDQPDDYLAAYVDTLARGGKYDLTIWPFHALLGGIGHALVSAVEEALFFHTIARRSQTRFEIKGQHALTEHYSALGPEVERGPRGERLAGRNDALIDHLRYVRRRRRRRPGQEPLRRVDGGGPPRGRARARVAALPPRGLLVAGRRPGRRGLHGRCRRRVRALRGRGRARRPLDRAARVLARPARRSRAGTGLTRSSRSTRR